MNRTIIFALTVALSLGTTACTHTEEEVGPQYGQPLPLPRTYDGQGIDAWVSRIQSSAGTPSSSEFAPILASFGPEALPHLEKWLSMGSPAERLLAADTAALMGAEATPVVPSLATLLNSPEVALRAGAARAMGSVGDGAREYGASLAQSLHDPEWSVRYHAAMALAATKSNQPIVRTTLIDRSRHDLDARVRDACVVALGGRMY